MPACVPIISAPVWRSTRSISGNRRVNWRLMHGGGRAENEIFAIIVNAVVSRAPCPSLARHPLTRLQQRRAQPARFAVASLAQCITTAPYADIIKHALSGGARLRWRPVPYVVPATDEMLYRRSHAVLSLFCSHAARPMREGPGGWPAAKPIEMYASAARHQARHASRIRKVVLCARIGRPPGGQRGRRAIPGEANASPPIRRRPARRRA